MPTFMFNCWCGGERDTHPRYFIWFLLLGRGISLHRSAEKFKTEVSRKFTKHLFDVPDDFQPNMGCMLAEVFRLGGTKVEFQRLSKHGEYLFDPTMTMRHDVLYAKFWENTVKWLFRFRDEFTDENVTVILHWAMNMFKKSTHGLEGRIENQHANHKAVFSWKGRTFHQTYKRALAYQKVLSATMHRRDFRNQEGFS